MADQTLKIVQSPVVTDVQLPLPVHFNGLDQPILDGYALAGDYVKKVGDTMSGRLSIHTELPLSQEGDPPSQTISLYVHGVLSGTDEAVDTRLYGILVNLENGSSVPNLLVDLQIGVQTAS